MDRNEHFRGKLMSGDQVVLDRVEGQLRTRVKPNSAHSDWSGYLAYPPERRAELAEGHRYRLLLIDGRSGHVQLHFADHDPLGRTIADFKGTGAYRK